MNKMKNQVNLDKTLSYTKSSFAVKDPYLVNGGPIYRATNWVKSFIAIRQIENEFIDFKSYNLDSQFRDINAQVFKAFSRHDKVTLQRSLSEAMYAWALSLRQDKNANPFMKEIDTLRPLQSRIYSENDHMLPEEQWAQITVLLQGRDARGAPSKLYTVFERRTADLTDYYDWKISFLAEEEDFILVNDVKL